MSVAGSVVVVADSSNTTMSETSRGAVYSSVTFRFEMVHPRSSLHFSADFVTGPSFVIAIASTLPSQSRGARDGLESVVRFGLRWHLPW